MSKLIDGITVFIVIAIVVVGAALVEPITAQNMTGNQSGDQTGELDLLPPRVVEEDTQAEILGGQQ
jgi:hypothetical protein